MKLRMVVRGHGTEKEGFCCARFQLVTARRRIHVEAMDEIDTIHTAAAQKNGDHDNLSKIERDIEDDGGTPCHSAAKP